MTKIEVVPKTQKMHTEGNDGPALGEWYWITNKDKRKLVCISTIGSNFVEVSYIGKYTATQRFAYEDFLDCSEREYNADEVISEEVNRRQEQVQSLMGAVADLTARLAVTPREQLSEPQPETQSLSLVSGSGQNLNEYKADLIKAKKKTLPDLFKDIENSHEEMAVWMKARTLPLKIKAESMKEVIDRIEDRIFNIELYAGLTEKVGQFAEGEPALLEDKLHIMQRLHYMDEECLVNYSAGGMDFSSVGQFNSWLAKPENRDRILPFPRCLVSFQVRRHKKERVAKSLSDYISFYQMEVSDTATIFYIRNGDNLYWIESSLNLGEKLFPGKEWSLLNEELMFPTSFRSYGKPITRRAYEQLVEEYKIKTQAELEKPKIDRRLIPFDNPERSYEAFTPESIYYDEMKEYIDKETKQYNRIALIIQGLFDRSPVLHPHPPVKTWDPVSFNKMIELILDSDRALYADKKPDFQTYFNRLNKLLKPGDVTMGQDYIWEKKEAEKENDRTYKSKRWSFSNQYHELETYRPYGNPGPGLLAIPDKLTKKYATFRWERERLTQRDWYSDKSETVPASIRIPRKELFNISGYKPGDYKIFFSDPRTREEYLEWAPFLLAAEDYHAGKRKVGPEEP